METLELLKCNGEWIAVYQGEEGHNIQGEDIYGVIWNAAFLFGIELTDEKTNIKIQF